MIEWPETTLGEVADVLVGFAFRSAQFTSDRDDLRLLRGVNIGQGKLTWSQTATLPANLLHDDRYRLAEADVVLAMDRPWIEAGLKRARVRDTDLPLVLVQRVARLRGTDRATTSFLHHLLATDSFSAYLRNVVTGATVPHISQSQIEAFKVRLPPMEVQECIGGVLDAIDDLIDNNRRRVEALEAMGRAIYREWFVRFRYPGHESVPLVDSPLGPIPDGWAAMTMGDVLELRYGKALKKDDRRGGPVAVVSSAGIVGWHDESLVSGPAIVVGRKGNVGSVTWVDDDSWPIDTAYFVETDLPLRYVAEQLRRAEFLNTHAAVPGLSRDQAYSRPFLRPPHDLMERFESAVGSLAGEGRALALTSERLVLIRDRLLPKLVTGQIDVSHLVDELTEAATA